MDVNKMNEHAEDIFLISEWGGLFKAIPKCAFEDKCKEINFKQRQN